jgi:hypothetical protein
MFEYEDNQVNEYRFVPARDPADASKIIGLFRIAGLFENVTEIQFQTFTIGSTTQTVLGGL